jgi:hypothetical protein
MVPPPDNERFSNLCTAEFVERRREIVPNLCAREKKAVNPAPSLELIPTIDWIAVR